MTAFRNVVLYGAGSQNIGKALLDAFRQDGTFNITVLARQSSNTSYPADVTVVKVPDDLPHAELVGALKGQDALISAVNHGGIAAQTKVIDAAVEAGVKRFVPSEWGFDNGDPKQVAASPIFAPKNTIQKYLEVKVKQHPSFSWHSLATSIWLEWALDTEFLNIFTSKHEVNYWDNGDYAPSVSTLAYAGKAAVESLKHPDETKNKRIFMSAFTASQREIVAELEKQQGVKYAETNPINGKQAVKEAQEQWVASGETDFAAAYRLVTASIFMEEYGNNWDQNKKQPRLEDITQMPKLTLQGVVQDVIAKQQAQ